MMTIREAINLYTNAKAEYLGRNFLDVIQNTTLSLIVPLKNGSKLFIDTYTDDYFKEKYPLEQPNKNGVFKRISFEIYNKEPILTSIKKYTSVSSANDTLYYVDNAKERCVNEFLCDNGGIDYDAFYKTNIKGVWEKSA